MTQANLNCHIANEHPRVRANKIYKCKICLQEFSGSCALRKHRNSQHGFLLWTSNLDMDTLVKDMDDAELKEELILAINSSLNQLEKGRHCMFNFVMSSFNNSICNAKMDHVLNQLKCAAKVNLAFGFVLKNIEDGLC